MTKALKSLQNQLPTAHPDSCSPTAQALHQLPQAPSSSLETPEAPREAPRQRRTPTSPLRGTRELPPVAPNAAPRGQQPAGRPSPGAVPSRLRGTRGRAPPPSRPRGSPHRRAGPAGHPPGPSSAPAASCFLVTGARGGAGPGRGGTEGTAPFGAVPGPAEPRGRARAPPLRPVPPRVAAMWWHRCWGRARGGLGAVGPCQIWFR